MSMNNVGFGFLRIAEDDFFEGGLCKIGNSLSPHEKKTSRSQFPHVRILTLKELVELVKFVGFKVEMVVGNCHI
ncbi:MAG: hypothetical protein QW739_03950 [Candidatus Odinarchaeota archaeon]